MTGRQERRQIIANAKRIRRNVEQIFVDCAYWNEHVRKPDEAPIDPDPDGAMRTLADGLDRMLAEDPGAGPIPPVGGWSITIAGRCEIYADRPPTCRTFPVKRCCKYCGFSVAKRRRAVRRMIRETKIARNWNKSADVSPSGAMAI